MGSTYEVTKTMEGVKVKLPGRNSLNQKFITEHEVEQSDGNTVVVDGHYRDGLFAGKEPTGETVHLNGKPVPILEDRFLNRHFYGVGEDDLGKSICARVEVVLKTMEDGRQFTLVNVHRTPNVKPTHRLKFPRNGDDKPQIVFEELPRYQHECSECGKIVETSYDWDHDRSPFLCEDCR